MKRDFFVLCSNSTCLVLFLAHRSIFPGVENLRSSGILRSPRLWRGTVPAQDSLGALAEQKQASCLYIPLHYIKLQVF